eukprot:NODE_4794_length_306_cov_34.175097_g4712_i0.p1 GENE.NODE_4794_length_306_cov_34.175097_g4712_i0~~NODE_4794_length_306_cov_34.175097_g4712_i0.p1  ORF type:complete len:89 (+),score=18.78 NODE_4794_length_306_cov_34.175097_g4712_i0:28-294(+)
MGKYGNQQLRTKTLSNTSNPVWNEELKLRIQEGGEPVKVFMYDKDRFGQDEVLGSGLLDVESLAAGTKVRRTLQLKGNAQLFLQVSVA